MRRALTVIVPLLALGLAACSSSSDDSASTTTTMAMSAGTATTVAATPGTSPADTGVPGTGAFVPTTARSVDPSTLPGPAQRASSWAGADEIEVNCINATLADALAGNEAQASRNDVVAAMAGTAIVECLPPMKLGAVTTDKLRASSVGSNLTPAQLSCVTSTLNGGELMAFSVFIGGLVVDDAAIVRQGATPIDAACGTALSAG